MSGIAIAAGAVAAVSLLVLLLAPVRTPTQDVTLKPSATSTTVTTVPPTTASPSDPAPPQAPQIVPQPAPTTQPATPSASSSVSAAGPIDVTSVVNPTSVELTFHGTCPLQTGTATLRVTDAGTVDKTAPKSGTITRGEWTVTLTKQRKSTTYEVALTPTCPQSTQVAIQLTPPTKTVTIPALVESGPTTTTTTAATPPTTVAGSKATAQSAASAAGATSGTPGAAT